MILPEPVIDGQVAVERAIKNRRTVRSFSSKSLGCGMLSQLLWAAQGITEPSSFKRAAPSGGALYPMDVYAVIGTGGIEGLEAGVYHYEPKRHRMTLVASGDRRNDVAVAALFQTWIAAAPVNLIITAEYERITCKYGDRGIRYAMIEAGHIGQNIFLQALAIGLVVGIVGAFRDQELIQALNISESHEPLLIMPAGYGPDSPTKRV